MNNIILHKGKKSFLQYWLACQTQNGSAVLQFCTTLLDIDDWKIICQVGFTSHYVKGKKAQWFHSRTSIYITCQQEMDFGEAHNDSMNRRLNKYFFQSLPHVELEANQ